MSKSDCLTYVGGQCTEVAQVGRQTAVCSDWGRLCESEDLVS